MPGVKRFPMRGSDKTPSCAGVPGGLRSRVGCGWQKCPRRRKAPAEHGGPYSVCAFQRRRPGFTSQPDSQQTMSVTAESASSLRLGPAEGSAGGGLPATTAHSRTYPWAVRARACIGIAILVPFGAAAFFTEPWWAGDSWQELSWEILAWSLLIGGTVIRFWATAYIGGTKARLSSVRAPTPFAETRYISAPSWLPSPSPPFYTA